jgi:hypothetical protein
VYGKKNLSNLFLLEEREYKTKSPSPRIAASSYVDQSEEGNGGIGGNGESVKRRKCI